MIEREAVPKRAKFRQGFYDVEVLERTDVIAVNKPAGMVVHAGAGRSEGTLVNALLHRYGALSQEGGPLRPGIVHRLDKGTTGVLLIARTAAASWNPSASGSATSVASVSIVVHNGPTIWCVRTI